MRRLTEDALRTAILKHMEGGGTYRELAEQADTDHTALFRFATEPERGVLLGTALRLCKALGLAVYVEKE